VPKRNKGGAKPPEQQPVQRNLVVLPEFWDHLRFWARTDRKSEERLLNLVEAIQREPFTGIGKPEPLEHELRGCWSRRITEEHRVVYRVTRDGIHPLSARDHYPKKR
jgi:toxin YoeB